MYRDSLWTLNGGSHLTWGGCPLRTSPCIPCELASLARVPLRFTKGTLGFPSSGLLVGAGVMHPHPSAFATIPQWQGFDLR